MELTIFRTYFPNGTNGKLVIGNELICHTIELPWKGNKQNVSCIPEGRYRLLLRIHPVRGKRIEITHVPKREAIFIHAANDALLELRGCVAPVRVLTEPGKGLYSKVSVKRVESKVFDALENGEQVWLVIRNAVTAGIEKTIN